MGQQHNELRRGTFSDAVAALLGDSRGGGVERYSETLEIPLGDLLYPFEHQFLLDRKVCGGRFDTGAAVGEQGMSELQVPAGTHQIVAILESVIVGAAASTEVQIRLFSGAAQEAAIANGPLILDTRWDTQRPFALMTEGTNAAPAGTAVYQFPVLANRAQRIRFPILIQRNNGLSVVCANTNVRIIGGLRWRERSLMPTESNV